MVYMLHSGNLFGTERMALETLTGFPDYQPVIMAPPGPLMEEIRRRGIFHYPITSKADLIKALVELLRKHKHLVFMTTALLDVLCLSALNFVFRRKLSHLHLVHGGASDHLSYGRKKWMNHMKLTQVAVSDYVRQRLLMYGVKPEKIQVVGNFLSAETLANISRRAAFQTGAPLKGVIVSRVIPAKRVHLLFEAMERHSDLKMFSFDVMGVGGQVEILRARAQAGGLPIELKGFVDDVHQRLAGYDFLLHLNCEEPFGMVILEAIAAGIPVLVPDSGGTATIITNQSNGLSFKADDPDDLARALRDLHKKNAHQLNQLVAAADQLLANTYHIDTQVAAYRALLSP